jgi:ABC-type nitrate/sulfonate/bicarbonate transport system substrate-binding protein
MELQKIVVCGVPEHFNLPWHLAIENGLFAKHGVLVLAPTLNPTDSRRSSNMCPR